MPGPATFNSPLRTITYALRNAGKLGQEATPSDAQFAEWLNRLNDLINLEQTRGLKLWLQTDLNLPLTLGLAKYRIGPGGNLNMTKPLRVIQAYYQESGGSRRPLDPPLSREEYTRLSQVNQAGTITSYFVDKQLTTLDVYLWNPPDAQALTGQVHLITQVQAGNPITLTEDMPFPQEWFMYLQWALADEASTGQPIAIIERCRLKRAEYRADLEGWDVEDASTRFVPDSRGGQNTGAFR